jgi:hypothetical protein
MTDSGVVRDARQPLERGDTRDLAEFAPHADCRPEESLGSVNDAEADPLIEGLSGSRRHLDALRSATRGAPDCVRHECAADAALHAIRGDEQAIEFMRTGVARDHNRKANRHSGRVDRDPNPPPVDPVLRELNRIGMRGKRLAVLLPDIRGSTLQGLERCRFPGHRVSDCRRLVRSHLDQASQEPVPLTAMPATAVPCL